MDFASMSVFPTFDPAILIRSKEVVEDGIWCFPSLRLQLFGSSWSSYPTAARFQLGFSSHPWPSEHLLEGRSVFWYKLCMKLHLTQDSLLAVSLIFP